MEYEHYNDRTLRALVAFHDHYGRDALGRAAEPPDPETVRDIERFARGELPSTELDSFFEKMASKPDWMELLAGNLKEYEDRVP